MRQFLENLEYAVTHNGVFHTDEVSAWALLCIVLERLGRIQRPELIRTRNNLENYSMLFDVGRQHSIEIMDGKNPDVGFGRVILDHHQGGIEPRLCGVAYSSFGLMFEWLKPMLRNLGFNNDALDMFEWQMVLPIDASDNGQDLVSEWAFHTGNAPVQPYILQNIINTFRPRWDENANMDERFDEAAAFMIRLISQKLDSLMANVKADEIVNEVVNYHGLDAKVLDFDRAFLPWQKSLLDTKSKALLVIFFDNSSGSWRCQAVPKKLSSFENRIKLPQMAELPEEIRQHITFVHKAGFIAGGTREGILALAGYAIGLDD